MNAIDMTSNEATAQNLQSGSTAKKEVRKAIRDKEAEFLGPVNFALQVACVVGLVWITLNYFV